MRETFSEFFVTILADLFTVICLTSMFSLTVGLIWAVHFAISALAGAGIFS